MQKQLERHILSFVPSAKIESTRFRSVAFQKPTTQLPSDDPSSSKSTDKPRDKEGRQHDRDRAASWRASKGEDEEESASASGKTFLTPHEKKRIAFIKQEIHSGVDSVNAYVVFAHPVPTENWPKNLPMPKPAMDPFEAAKMVVRKADGSVFMERTIRVDSAIKGKGKISDAMDAELAGDPKTTVFVGSLDFASKEEDVRAFFEGLIVAERGQPRAEDNGNSSTWVKRVRVIRDKDTLLGKGFGYVQFIVRIFINCINYTLTNLLYGRTVNASTKYLHLKKVASSLQNANSASSAARHSQAHPKSAPKSRLALLARMSEMKHASGLLSRFLPYPFRKETLV